MRCRTFHFPVVIDFFPDRWMDGWKDRFAGYQQIGGKKVFFPERLGEGRFLGAVSLSSLT